VREVPSYEKDYKPTFRQPATYLRCRSVNGWRSDYYIEYNLDEEDDRFLDAYNEGQNRLSADKLELMLHYLEVINAEATDRALTANGASEADKRTPTSCNTVEHLPKHTALDILQKISGVRLAVCEAVYGYWLAKRKRRGRPIIRRLQAPTPISDQDPYHVFRAREKIRGPQTRRKKENDVKSYDKLREIRASLQHALAVVEMIGKRERRKRELVAVQADQQMLTVRLRHDPRHLHEQVETEYLRRVQERTQRMQQDRGEGGAGASGHAAGAGAGAGAGGSGTPGQPGSGSTVGATDLRLVLGLANLLPRLAGKAKKYKSSVKDLKDPVARQQALAAVKQLPPPPAEPDLDLLFTLTPDLRIPFQEQSLALPEGLDLTRCRPRFGRGNRLIFDRCDPLTREPYAPLEHTGGLGLMGSGVTAAATPGAAGGSEPMDLS
jgi:enhancer of polycomb-like protein